jgi:Flp pilus assembly protein TadG
MSSIEDLRGAAHRRPRRLVAGAGFPRLWRNRDGTTVIETAILLPTFLLFLLGLTEFGRALWMQNTLQYAAEAASRCAVVYAGSTCNSTTATQNYAVGKVLGPSLPSSTFSVSSSGTCGNGGSKTVSASYAFSFIVPQLFPYSITLTAQSAYPC